MKVLRGLAVAAVAVGMVLTTAAQERTQFQDTSILKPPPGAKVAVVEFEDLECPACAAAAPIIHRAVEQYHIPLVRYDFPLPMHIWSFDAAIYARWMQDTANIGPKVANDYRLAVFAAQQSIASKDDLQRFTRKFAQQHGLALPFVVDPTGKFTSEIRADAAKGQRLNVQHTPTIVVVTPNHYDELVGDANQIYGKIEAALAATKGATVKTSTGTVKTLTGKTSAKKK